eukprot:757407-Hanusia_phi.AAC.1
METCRISDTFTVGLGGTFPMLRGLEYDSMLPLLIRNHLLRARASGRTRNDFCRLTCYATLSLPRLAGRARSFPPPVIRMPGPEQTSQRASTVVSKDSTCNLHAMCIACLILPASTLLARTIAKQPWLSFRKLEARSQTTGKKSSQSTCWCSRNASVRQLARSCSTASSWKYWAWRHV